MRNLGTVGRYNKPGVPNIFGELNNTAYVTENNATGAFESIGVIGVGLVSGTYLFGSWHVGINAQNCNSVYGASDTVMPSSVDICIGIYLGRYS